MVVIYFGMRCAVPEPPEAVFCPIEKSRFATNVNIGLITPPP